MAGATITIHNVLSGYEQEGQIYGLLDGGAHASPLFPPQSEGLLNTSEVPHDQALQTALTARYQRPKNSECAAATVTDLAAVYNFLSTFSGTHFLSPRTVMAHVGFKFQAALVSNAGYDFTLTDHL